MSIIVTVMLKHYAASYMQKGATVGGHVCHKEKTGGHEHVRID